MKLAIVISQSVVVMFQHLAPTLQLTSLDPLLELAGDLGMNGSSNLLCLRAKT